MIGDDGIKHYAHRCTNHNDALCDRGGTNRLHISSGSDADISTNAINSKMIDDAEIFYTTPYGIFYPDKFKRRLEEAGLLGSKFIEVWNV